MRTIWTAEELQLHYTLTPMAPRTGETKTPAFTAMNPKQKIPFMVDGELSLAESVAISRYLIYRYASPAVLHPNDVITEARINNWVCYAFGELDETGLYVMRRHRDLGHIYGYSEEAVQSAREYTNRHLLVMESELGDREFVVDEGFSLADIVLTTCLDWAEAYRLELPDGLAAYLSNIRQRAAYKKAKTINFNANV